MQKKGKNGTNEGGEMEGGLTGKRIIIWRWICVRFLGGLNDTFA